MNVLKCPHCNEKLLFLSQDAENGLIGKWLCSCTYSAEDRYKAFMEEYSRLCDKYKMRHELADLLGLGIEYMEIYDEKEEKFMRE